MSWSGPLVKGESTFHFRLGKSVNNTVYNAQMSTSGNTAFKAGTANSFTCTMIGSHVKVAFADAERSGGDEDLRWTMSRKGGIGISVPAGSDVKLTKMRIRVLR